MNVRSARRIRLTQLKEEHKTLKELADRIVAHAVSSGDKKAARQSGYLDRYLSQIYTGHRGMGGRLARKIEAAFQKQEGWMDHVGASSAQANELLHIWAQFPEPEQERILEELRIRLRVMKDKLHISRIVRPPHHLGTKRNT